MTNTLTAARGLVSHPCDRTAAGHTRADAERVRGALFTAHPGGVWTRTLGDHQVYAVPEPVLCADGAEVLVAFYDVDQVLRARHRALDLAAGERIFALVPGDPAWDLGPLAVRAVADQVRKRR